MELLCRAHGHDLVKWRRTSNLATMQPVRDPRSRDPDHRPVTQTSPQRPGEDHDDLGHHRRAAPGSADVTTHTGTPAAPWEPIRARGSANQGISLNGEVHQVR